jgi:hypothetical protein
VADALRLTPENPALLLDVDPALGWTWSRRKGWAAQRAGLASGLEDGHPCREVASRYAVQVAGCGHHLLFARSPDKPDRELVQAFTCQHRLCPICAPLRSSDLRDQIGAMLSMAIERGRRGLLKSTAAKAPWWSGKLMNLVPLHLTLTVKNCDWDELPKLMKGMGKAFTRMTRTKAFKNAVVGCVRAIEFTKGRDGKAHPHLHVLLLVDADTYFKKDVLAADSRYIDHDQWVQMWRKSMVLDYDPSVRIKRFRPKEGQKITVEFSAAIELCKYVTKPDKKVPLSGDELAWILQSIDGRRLLESYGCCRDLMPEAQEEVELEAEDLAEEEPEPLRGKIVEVWKWEQEFRDYLLKGTYDSVGVAEELQLIPEIAEFWPINPWIRRDDNVVAGKTVSWLYEPALHERPKRLTAAQVKRERDLEQYREALGRDPSQLDPSFDTTPRDMGGQLPPMRWDETPVTWGVRAMQVLQACGVPYPRASRLVQDAQRRLSQQ